MKPDVTALFHADTFTVSYLVREPGGPACAIIDPVLDFDAAAGRIRTTSADRLIRVVRENELQPVWILDTQMHADHFSAAAYLRRTLSGRTGAGRQRLDARTLRSRLFASETGSAAGTLPHDRQFEDGERFRIGGLEAQAISTPGYGPAGTSYRIGDALFVGSALRMPDRGTARCDLPGGDAALLWDSLQHLLSLPEGIRLFCGHDDGAPGRDRFAWESTVGRQRKENVDLIAAGDREGFVVLRRERERGLPRPPLLLPALRYNAGGGHAPPRQGPPAFTANSKPDRY